MSPTSSRPSVEPTIATFDWVPLGAVGPVLDQGNCGMIYSVVTVVASVVTVVIIATFLLVFHYQHQYNKNQCLEG